jgi:hypothetical protein
MRGYFGFGLYAPMYDMNLAATANVVAFDRVWGRK